MAAVPVPVAGPQAPQVYELSRPQGDGTLPQVRGKLHVQDEKAMKRSPIRRKQKRHENETPETRKAVYDRVWCEKCGMRGTEIHHRVAKKMGGTTKVYEAHELALLCAQCHRAITERRER